MAYTKEMNDPAGMKDILLAVCPQDKRGNRSLKILAEALDLHYYTIYKWVNRGRIPANQVNRLIALSNGQLTHESLHKFVFGES